MTETQAKSGAAGASTDADDPSVETPTTPTRRRRGRRGVDHGPGRVAHDRRRSEHCGRSGAGSSADSTRRPPDSRGRPRARPRRRRPSPGSSTAGFVRRRSYTPAAQLDRSRSPTPGRLGRDADADADAERRSRRRPTAPTGGRPTAQRRRPATSSLTGPVSACRRPDGGRRRRRRSGPAEPGGVAPRGRPPGSASSRSGSAPWPALAHRPGPAVDWPEPGQGRRERARLDRSAPVIARAAVGAPPTQSGLRGTTGTQPVVTPGRAAGSSAVGAARVTEAVRSARATVAGAATRGPRRARLHLKRIDPWSVMKFAFAVSLVLFVVAIVATSVLYLALDAMGVFDSINKALSADVTGQAGGAAGRLQDHGQGRHRHLGAARRGEHGAVHRADDARRVRLQRLRRPRRRHRADAVREGLTAPGSADAPGRDRLGRLRGRYPVWARPRRCGNVAPRVTGL